MTTTFIRIGGPTFEPPRAFEPLKPDHPLVGDTCPACDDYFRAGDRTALIPLGPGRDAEAQGKAQNGQFFTAVAIAVHAYCAGCKETTQ